MQIIKYPARNTWQELLKRPANDYASIVVSVKEILNDIKVNGDNALSFYTQKFDGPSLSGFRVTDNEWNMAEETDINLRQAIDTAIKNITLFHSAQAEQANVVEVAVGITCWRKSVGIEKVGLYIPGGTAPLFSTLLMLAIPAQLAGCREIIVCTPPDRNGAISPTILYAAKQLGISQLYKAGGVQAIGAMAYGTASIPKVYKIFGPGNSYVTCAKMLLAAEGIAIDMPAGPSEVAVLADESCRPEFVAADLLSQAEHGIDSQTLLVTDNENVINEVNECIAMQIDALPRKEIAAKALANSKAILVKDLSEGIELLNDYAPEHLIISCSNSDSLANDVINAGSVFLGNYSPESAGDYATGTNHTLPTNGFAKAYSGVSLDSFIKKITFQKLSQNGLQSISDTVKQMALAEGLDAHANAITIRTNQVYEQL
ncbi:MAG: histidinol dehydrogenase [Bacteroidetes bacterium]|nr:histidinol dehydrogenase [Bacteroidota bacterium]